MKHFTVAVLAVCSIGATVRSASATTISVALTQTTGFQYVEFTQGAGTVMAGQTLGVDLLFPSPITFGPAAGNNVWSELFLLTGPQAYPGDYSPYVVFGSGSTAYLLDGRGSVLDTPMRDFVNGGTMAAPELTLGVLLTARGWAGADAIAYLSNGGVVSGVHYDLVLPATGQTLSGGYVGVNAQQVPDTAGGIAVPLIGLGSVILLAGYARRTARA
jgi:hypothetical protein